MTGRHHDDHRLDLLIREEIVEYDAGAANRCPGIVRVECAMQSSELVRQELFSESFLNPATIVHPS
jgi:hypothetical protein